MKKCLGPHNNIRHVRQVLRGGGSSSSSFSPRCLRVQRAFATATNSTAGGGGQQQGQQQQFDNRVKLVEVGPRDGLQNERKSIPLATKIELIRRLANTGLATIEAGSFVAPRWVPQMESSNEILEHILTGGIEAPGPVSYSFLAPNLKGLAAATATLQAHPGSFTVTAPSPSPAPNTGAGDGEKQKEKKKQKPGVELAVFAAATEAFTQRNLNCSVATSLARFRQVIAEAKRAVPDVRVRAYISVVLGCPFEGPGVDPARVAAMATDLLEMGADEIALGDTTGMGTAPRTAALLRGLAAAGVRVGDLAVHLHDTYGQALVNLAVALEHGVRVFDAAVGGLGGCPYSPGATGNVATEDVVYFLESLGMETGVDLDGVVDVGEWITGELGKANASAVGRAVLGARERERGNDGKGAGGETA